MPEARPAETSRNFFKSISVLRWDASINDRLSSKDRDPLDTTLEAEVLFELFFFGGCERLRPKKEPRC